MLLATNSMHCYLMSISKLLSIYPKNSLPSKSSDVMPRDSYASKMSLFSTFSVFMYGYSNDDNDELGLEFRDSGSGFLFEETDSINDGI